MNKPGSIRSSNTDQTAEAAKAAAAPEACAAADTAHAHAGPVTSSAISPVRALASRRRLLLLTHRIPYPPDKGDKIRSYHLLAHLAQRHRVHLGAFVDDRADLAHEAALRAICAEVQLFPIDARARKLASLTALGSGEPLSVRFYRDRRARTWVDALRVRERLDAVITSSSTMAQFVLGPQWASTRRIADFVDVDSEKWRQYAATMSGPKSWVFAREARTLLAFERRVAAAFEKTLFVSEVEAALFIQHASESAERVGFFSNGVDTNFFDPALTFSNPYPEGGPVIVFTGAMNYPPNIEATKWFADEVFPLVAQRHPGARFFVVGSNPSDAVRRYGERPGIRVTGRVPDVRPYLKHAAVSVVPLRIARGIQNKVLEALAMSRPVVCTGAAAAGIDPQGVVLAVTEDDAYRFADAVSDALYGGERPDGRRLVVERFGWQRHLQFVDALLDANGGPLGQ